MSLTGASFAVAQSSPPPAAAPDAQAAPSVPERVAALKQSLGQSKAMIKDFEWIETTTVFIKGEEKSNTQKRCYYGADGKVQKIVINALPEAEKPRGVRGRIVEKKKEELTSYMKQAVALVHEYVPLDPELIQKAKDAGRVSIAILEPGRRISLNVGDYVVSGDLLSVEVMLADNRLAGIGISTILDDETTKEKEKDPIALKVLMSTLENDATYAEEITLEAKEKHLKIVVTNSGYRKMAQ